jgi:hypothetical protein
VPVTPEELLSLQVGPATVADHLRRAIKAGEVVENADGSLELRVEPASGAWMYVRNGPPLACDFLIGFLFRRAYGRAAVPQGCSACYKVKLVARTLRELIAAWQLAQGVEASSKWGLDVNNPHSQSLYAGYFYVTSLEAARALFRTVRAAVDSDPKLGPEVEITIKRGCSEYEAALGPSDGYTFAPQLAEVEAHLASRYRPRRRPARMNAPLAQWIDFAFRSGDDTYLDCTGGRRLRAKTVSYEP